jgi:RNA polymerase sigma factor (sigma-70 family)
VEDAYSSELERLCTHRLLSADEEKQLARKIQQGGLEGKRAKDKLVEHNMRLALSQAVWFKKNTYLGRSVEIEDLFIMAVCGVVAAADKFDPDRGFKFSTMASWWIRQALQRGLDFEAAPIRMPNQARQIIATHNAHPELTPTELAAKTGRGMRAVYAALHAPSVVTSTDEPKADGESQWEPADEHAELAYDDFDDYGRTYTDELAAALDSLPADQREVIELMYGFRGEQRTTGEAAEELDLPYGTVSRLHREGLDRLRELPGFAP